jgi:protein-disulfide isomerase
MNPRLLFAAFAALLISLAPFAQAGRAAPAAHDWSGTVTRLPSGAYVHGNPAAKVKLVEYFSLTCPHCAHFSEESVGPLGAYIKAGTVSLELRHSMHDLIDFSASLMVRCTGQRAYFNSVHAVLAAQPQWVEKTFDYAQANAEKLNKLPRPASLAETANVAGFGPLLHLSPAQVTACAANEGEQKLLGAMTDESIKRDIPGTPAFLINGQLVDKVASWDLLAPKLAAAVR